MSRRHITFSCEGTMLAGTLDEAVGATGLLIVSGGNEIRSGAFTGQAQLAKEIANAGYPVFRFDRRGIGDSEGANYEFRSSGPDIKAAAEALRSEVPQLDRVVGLGNCDAASALMLAKEASLDALVLMNPWTFEDDDGMDTAPPDAVRAHYRQRLADPAAIKRLLTGQVSVGRLLGSLKSALSPAPPPSSLAQDMAQGLAEFNGPATILIAERDRTAQAFLGAWDKKDTRIRRCPDATHAFVEPEARQWLFERVMETMREA